MKSEEKKAVTNFREGKKLNEEIPIIRVYCGYLYNHNHVNSGYSTKTGSKTIRKMGVVKKYVERKGAWQDDFRELDLCLLLKGVRRI